MPPDPKLYEFDPVFLNSRREAKFILVTFFLFAIYTISVSYRLGYADSNQEQVQMALVFGMPRWVFWGIVVPWLAANIITGWFCFGLMSNDSLAPQTSPTALADNSHELQRTENQTSDGQQTAGEQNE